MPLNFVTLPAVGHQRGQLTILEGLLVAAFAAMMFALNLGGYPLFDVDEGAFAEASREMLASRDFGMTTLDGAPRYDKPIFIYWLQATTMALVGVDEWGARLPSALAGVLWVLAVWHFARPRLGANAAVLAAVLLASSLGVWAIARAATADAWLNLWLTLAAFDWWRHLESHREAPRRRAFVWMGLGVLTKGPVAVLVPMATVTLYLLSRREGTRLLRCWWDPAGWSMLLAIAAPWYAYALWRDGWAFVEGFFLKHNVQRFVAPLEGHSGQWWYHLALLPALLLPFSLLIVLPLRALLLDARVMLRRFLWLWFLFVLGFFSLAQTKLPHYMLYGLTPLVLLIARHLADSSRAHRWLLATVVSAALVIVVSALLPELLPHWVQTRTLSPFHQALASGASAAWSWQDRAAGLAALLLLAVVGQARHWLNPAATLAAAGLVLGVWLSFRLLPWAGETLQGPIQRAGLAARGMELVNAGLRAPSFSFYRQAISPRRVPQPGEAFLARLDRLPPLPHEVWWYERGVVLARALPSMPTSASEPEITNASAASKFEPRAINDSPDIQANPAATRNAAASVLPSSPSTNGSSPRETPR